MLYVYLFIRKNTQLKYIFHIVIKIMEIISCIYRIRTFKNIYANYTINKN